ncbi:MAG TPA: DUF3048 domain-containing protein [Mycobacteriales bacterium]|nr:DUF3048 domain-containing protein [Mycobacteriales bacterium]
MSQRPARVPLIPVRRRRRAVAVVLAAGCLAAAACGGSKKPAAAPTPTPTPSPSESPSPSPIPPGSVSPLSGRPARQGLPVLGVKVDNVAGAFPQAGLTSADMVFVEQVEGGLTRLLAIFSSDIPKQVGPVRSARTDNLELLRQFGTPTLAFSGANAYVLNAVRSSPIKNGDPDSDPSAYTRVGDHVAPHNLFLDPNALLKVVKGSPAKSIGLTFDDTKVTEGNPASKVTVTYPMAQLVFTYDKVQGDWVVKQDGADDKLEDGKFRRADTVVVIHVTSRRDFDPITPYNITVGRGSGTVFRDGRAIPVSWNRANETTGMTFKDKSGKVVPMRVGQTWVVVLPEDASATGAA